MTLRFGLAVILAAAVAAACGSGAPESPSSPAPASSDSDATGQGREVQISGTLSRLAGSCPSVRFLIGRVTVQTDRSTTFVGGGCASLATGVGAAVRGARQSDGSLAASTVTTRGTQTR